MAELVETDICVIGAGSGGLSVAAGASQMGARTVLIERDRMGGDCLNFGCVPSKALLAAARAAQNARTSERFGIRRGDPDIDFGAVMDHVADVISSIAPHDSVERFEGLGVHVIKGHARFTGPREVTVEGGAMVHARRFVIAAGSSPAIPPIPGLADVPCLTNETVFRNRGRPEHLLVIGGGPIGLEMAQAHARLGARVTVLEAFRALAKDDDEARAVVLESLHADGIAVREGVKIARVERADEGVALILGEGDGAERIAGSHLLVAAGRRANTGGLGLDAAGIDHTEKGITVDNRLRTTNRRVFAIGDIAGAFQFTHVAGYHAGIVIRNALFRLPAKVSYHAVPWVTYTDPELAQIGMTESQSRANHGEGMRVLRADYSANDRARTERRTEGFIKVMTTRRGHILGVTVVGHGAGELLAPWALAMSQKMKVGAMAGLVLPYPTFGEISKFAAGSFYTPTLFGPRTRKLVRFLLKFA